MANPQKENGYTSIAHEIIEALARIKIPGQARQVLDVIFRKTYGWNKSIDEISLNQFVECTGLSKVRICRGIQNLLSMNIITKNGNAISHFTKNGNDYSVTYGIQKDYDKWRTLPKIVTLPKKITYVTKKDNVTLPKKIMLPIKTNIKLSNTKQKELPSFKKNEVNEDFYLTKKKKKLSGKRLESFIQFWNAFDYKSGKAEAADTWLEISSLTNTIVDEIIIKAKRESLNRPELISSGKTPKMAQGWLSGKRWEDEVKTYIQEEGFKPRNIKEAKDLEQIQMAKYLKEKRRERANDGDNTRATNGNERQLPESTSS